MKARVPTAEVFFAFIGVLLLIFFGNVRDLREKSHVDSYSSYDASGGGYRAWYELLQREGMDIARFERHWFFLDRSIATLICAAPSDLSQFAASAAMTPTGPPMLAAWVREGGTLVMLGAFPWSGKLDAPFAGLVYHAFSRDGIEGKGIREASMGRGRVVRIVDETPFTNGRIANADAARLAYALVQPSRAGVTAFDETLHGHLIPEHWWQVAPRRLVFALIGACVTVSIALLGATFRLGPPILPPERREATSSEYLDAVASLYARADAKCKVLLDVTNSVRRLAARVPSPEDARDVLIALDELAARSSLSESAFVDGVVRARRLRNELLKYTTYAASKAL